MVEPSGSTDTCNEKQRFHNSKVTWRMESVSVNWWQGEATFALSRSNTRSWPPCNEPAPAQLSCSSGRHCPSQLRRLYSLKRRREGLVDSCGASAMRALNTRVQESDECAVRLNEVQGARCAPIVKMNKSLVRSKGKNLKKGV